MVAENIHALPHGWSMEILMEGGSKTNFLRQSKAKLKWPKTWGRVQARKLPKQGPWIFLRRMQLYSSAVCSTPQKSKLHTDS